MLNILSLGAGVQSTTVALMSAVGELEPLDCCIFAHTGWEPAAVYRHLNWLEVELARHGIQVHRVSRGNLRDHILSNQVGGGRAAGKKRFASMPLRTIASDGSRGMMKRQCTREFKVEPIERFIRTELLGLKKHARWPKERVVRQWYGISADEGRRMKYPTRHKRYGVHSGEDLFGDAILQQVDREIPIPWKSHVYPLCDTERLNDCSELRCGNVPMTRVDCQTWLSVHGFPDAPRSACIGCPFHSDAQWAAIREVREEWADAVAFDKAIRHCEGLDGEAFVHLSGIPLDEVKLDATDDYALFQCGDGECGV